MEAIKDYVEQRFEMAKKFAKTKTEQDFVVEVHADWATFYVTKLFCSEDKRLTSMFDGFIEAFRIVDKIATRGEMASLQRIYQSFNQRTRNAGDNLTDDRPANDSPVQDNAKSL